VTLELPMQIAMRRWAKNQDAASVSFGPLSFSLAIGERWEKYGDPQAKWPEWEVFPRRPGTMAWCLTAATRRPRFELVRQRARFHRSPFTPQTVPLL